MLGSGAMADPCRLACALGVIWCVLALVVKRLTTSAEHGDEAPAIAQSILLALPTLPTAHCLLPTGPRSRSVRSPLAALILQSRWSAGEGLEPRNSALLGSSPEA